MTSITSLARGVEAYRQLTATRPAAGAAPAAAADFAQALQDATHGLADSLRRGEAAATAGVAGQGSVREVVLAVSQAELALQTAIAVRDKVIQAYQDVLRMPI